MNTASTAVAGAPQTSSASFFIMLAVFCFFLYFAVWRPQNKRAKEQQNLLTSLAKGDEVMTVGGVLVRISLIADQYIGLSIANNVEIFVQKSAVASLLPKGTLSAIK